jgi:adenylate cyclase
MIADISQPAIDLAREPDFEMGGLRVRPSLLAIQREGGQETVEPRVMQALVVLARNANQVISRDELVATCWDGRNVGDDAINRCISRLRRLARDCGVFEIETVPRVGYRLLDRTPPLSAATAPVDEVVLAVLAFENLSGDPELQYFSDGVSEEILNTLSQRTRLKVIGRSSSFQFRGPDKSVPHVARLLGVTHVLDGAVRRSGPRIRVSAQLIDCGSQTTLWASQFERELSDIFALQDEIAAAVARAMRCAFDPAVRSGALEPAVYDLYLQASLRPGKMKADTLAVQAAHFEQVLRSAPLFADAWGGLGYVRAILARFLPPAAAAEMLEKGRAAALHALALDPRCAQAAVALARCAPARNVLEQDDWLGKALAWRPNDAQVARLYARLMAAVGRGRDALVLMRQAHRLDPLDDYALGMLGRTLFESGAFDEAETVLTRGLARWPDNELFPLWLVYTLGVLGEPERALAVLQRHDTGVHRPELAAFLDLYGDPGARSAERAVAALRQQSEQTGRITFDRLVVAAELGGAEAVMEIALRAEFDLEQNEADPRGLVANDPALLFMSFAPGVRRDPRFIQLCARLGLVDYWLATDKWPDCVAETQPYYDFKAECARVAAA